MIRQLLAQSYLQRSVRRFWYGLPIFAGFSKTALIVDVETGNEEVITELV